MTQCSLQPKEASKFYARHKTRYRAPCGKDNLAERDNTTKAYEEWYMCMYSE